MFERAKAWVEIVDNTGNMDGRHKAVAAAALVGLLLFPGFFLR